MKEKQLKELLNSLNQLTAELSESDSLSIQIKDTKHGQFSVLSLDKNTVFTGMKLTQRSEIIVEANAITNPQL